MAFSSSLCLHCQCDSGSFCVCVYVFIISNITGGKADIKSDVSSENEKFKATIGILNNGAVGTTSGKICFIHKTGHLLPDDPKYRLIENSLSCIVLSFFVN